MWVAPASVSKLEIKIKWNSFVSLTCRYLAFSICIAYYSCLVYYIDRFKYIFDILSTWVESIFELIGWIYHETAVTGDHSARTQRVANGRQGKRIVSIRSERLNERQPIMTTVEDKYSCLVPDELCRGRLVVIIGRDRDVNDAGCPINNVEVREHRFTLSSHCILGGNNSYLGHASSTLTKPLN